jgi:DNA gyrase subunit A
MRLLLLLTAFVLTLSLRLMPRISSASVHQRLAVEQVRRLSFMMASTDDTDGVADESSDNDNGEDKEQLPESPLSRLPVDSEGNLILDPGVQLIELNDELKSSFMSYAMSTILGRALPDARDGLKPVHRRVLYAMHGLGLLPNSGYRKCARVVGEVLGKYHPHGDMSVYDALVRMAQDFVMLHPLVQGHGNFGSVDNDPAAAMRYTEAKLSSLAYDSLLLDIKEDTVDFVENFDGNEVEPVVLPARIPLLLLNGASGIAVGMATNIPPHNLKELCDAIVSIVDNPDISPEELLKIVPGPDFPTGGKIMGTTGSENLFKTGQGSIIMRAETHIENIQYSSRSGAKSSRNAIIVTQLPYMTNKSGLLEKIAELVNEKKIDGISDLRDESDRDGIRVVIELKRDAIPAVVQNNLFKKTALQTTFSGNMLALIDDGRQPSRLNLKQALEIFIEHRFKTLRRRTAHQLQKLKSRDHLVIGMIKALQQIDELIDLLRNSKDTATAKTVLMSDKYRFSNEQADSILALRLSRLTAMEEEKLKAEHKELTADISTAESIMQDDSKVYTILKSETMEIKEKHGVDRRSIITAEEGSLSDEDLLANDRSVIIITRSGYIKRIPVDEFESQSRGTKGKAGAKLSTNDDGIVQFFTCNDHDVVLFVTDKGIAYSIKAYQVPLGSRIAKGVPLPQILPFSAQERVTSVIPIESFDNENEHLVLLTKNGFVKKTPMKNFKSMSARGLIIISLSPGDSLGWSRRCLPKQEVLIATRDGFACRFGVDDLTSTGRTSRGVRALNLRDGDEMADIDINPFPIPAAPAIGEGEEVDTGKEAPAKRRMKNKHFIFAVTEKGYGKRIPIDDFRKARRGGRGVYAIKFKEKAGGGRKAARKSKVVTDEEDGEGTKLATKSNDGDALRCFRFCSAGDEVVISTSKGTIVRQAADDISVQTRSATGVLIQKLSNDDAVVMADVIPQLKEEEETVKAKASAK